MKEKPLMYKAVTTWILVVMMLLSVAAPAFAAQEEPAQDVEKAKTSAELEQKQQAAAATVGDKKAGNEKNADQAEVDLKRPTALSSKVIRYDQIRISWKKVSGADGYEIYRYSPAKKKYLPVAKVKGNAYVDKNRKVGTPYYYRIKAYQVKDGKYVMSDFSSRNWRRARPVAPTIKVQPGRKQVKISWNKIQGASCYAVYRATSENGKYVRVNLTDSSKTRSFTNKDLTTGKRYYFRVRACKKVGDKLVYSYASDSKVAKPKRPNLPYYNKAKKFYYQKKFTVKAYAYSGGGRTAMGTRAREGAIAVDPRVIPLGTEVYVDGYGFARAEDTGGNIKGRTVDLYKNTTSACYRWGVRYKTIYVGVVKA